MRKKFGRQIGRMAKMTLGVCLAASMVVGSVGSGAVPYMGMVEKIRDDINRTQTHVGVKNIVAILNGTMEASNTWMEKLYTTDVHIIGFGLYECEADFWWLLTHRASMYYANKGGQNLIRNTITYYDVFDDLPKNTKEKIEAALIREKETNKKYALLAGMHVRIKQYRLSDTQTGTYEEAYQKIINDIKQANETD